MPHSNPPSPKTIGISLFSLWKGKLQLSGLFMSCGGGGGGNFTKVFFIGGGGGGGENFTTVFVIGRGNLIP